LCDVRVKDLKGCITKARFAKTVTNKCTLLSVLGNVLLLISSTYDDMA
jgi:hypothetical protein